MDFQSLSILFPTLSLSNIAMIWFLVTQVKLLYLDPGDFSRYFRRMDTIRTSFFTSRYHLTVRGRDQLQKTNTPFRKPGGLIWYTHRSSLKRQLERGYINIIRQCIQETQNRSFTGKYIHRTSNIIKRRLPKYLYNHIIIYSNFKSAQLTSQEHRFILVLIRNFMKIIRRLWQTLVFLANFLSISEAIKLLRAITIVLFNSEQILGQYDV